MQALLWLKDLVKERLDQANRSSVCIKSSLCKTSFKMKLKSQVSQCAKRNVLCAYRVCVHSVKKDASDWLHEWEKLMMMWSKDCQHWHCLSDTSL